MSNPDRLRREAQEHAETLVEDRGLANALAWAIHCANRSTDGFWSRVVQAIEAIDCDPPLICPHCQESWQCDDLEETTWQQWQCPCCGSWNDNEKEPAK